MAGLAEASSKEEEEEEKEAGEPMPSVRIRLAASICIHFEKKTSFDRLPLPPKVDSPGRQAES